MSYPDHLAFQASAIGNVYLCLVHTEYLLADSIYLLDLFRHFPLYLVHGVVITLNSKQSEIVRHSFESIFAEQESNNLDKKQATLLHLQMILLQIQRAIRKGKCTSPAQSFKLMDFFQTALPGNAAPLFLQQMAIPLLSENIAGGGKHSGRCR